MKKMIITVVLAVVIATAGATVAFAGAIPAGMPRGASSPALERAAETRMINAVEAFREERRSRLKEFLNEKAADGTMTRAKADSIYEYMEERMEYCPWLQGTGIPDAAGKDRPRINDAGRGYCMGFYD